MIDNMEPHLTEEYRELYLAIKQKAKELGIPFTVNSDGIRFGNYLNFYLFWIGEKKGVLLFSARKQFCKSKKDNMVRIPFTNENKEIILNAITTIYNRYLEAKESGTLEEDTVALEELKVEKNTYTKNKETGTPTELLWNDVTVAVLEKLSQETTEPQDVDADHLKDVGKRLIFLFEQLLSYTARLPYPTSAKKLAVLEEHISSDKVTLASIGDKLGVSRERVRQLVNKAKRHLHRTFLKTLLFEDAVIDRLVEEIAELLRYAEYDLVALADFGLSAVGDRKKEALFIMLFGEDTFSKIAEKGELLEVQKTEKDIVQRRIVSLEEQWAYYQSKICFPASFTAAPTAVTSLSGGLTYQYEQRFRDKLKRFNVFFDIVESPDIVYYSSAQTEHRPQFLLYLPDGKPVLVLVLPTISLAYIYNVRRFNELHLFCRENGYGYIIVDQRGESIYDIKAKELDPQIVARLNAELKAKGKIDKDTLSQIRKELHLNDTVLAAYVLQNKLAMTRIPFVIKERTES